MPSPSPKPFPIPLNIDINSSANDTESSIASNNSMTRNQYAQGIPKFDEKRALKDFQYQPEYLRKLGKVVHDRSIVGQIKNLYNPFSRTSLNPFRSKHAPPKGTNSRRKRKHDKNEKGNLYTRHKLKLPKVGGNKRNTKSKSPPKLEIRIDEYKPESNDDSTDITQKGLGFTKKDGPPTILRKVKEISSMQNTRRQRVLSNNPFQRGNEHILKEERAMMKHEGRGRKTRTQDPRL